MKDIFLLDVDDTLLDFRRGEREQLLETLSCMGIAADGAAFPDGCAFRLLRPLRGKLCAGACGDRRDVNARRGHFFIRNENSHFICLTNAGGGMLCLSQKFKNARRNSCRSGRACGGAGQCPLRGGGRTAAEFPRRRGG